MYIISKNKLAVILSLSFLLLVVVVIGSASVGSYPINFYGAITGSDDFSRTILFGSRLPRILLAMLIGLSLSSVGGAYQSMLRNPLADPYILGVSGGAALGSVLAVALKLPFIFVSAFAFLGAIFSMLFIFFVARFGTRLSPENMLLTGVIFNAFSFAFILFINAIVNMEQAYQILFLLMGNLESIDYSTIAIVGILVMTGFAALCAVSKDMNILSLGDDDARALGVNVSLVRKMVFFFSSLMVGAAVAASGLIGFIGFFIPHAVRLVFGPDNRLLIPLSGIVGAAFLVFADTIARTILIRTDFATTLPVGVMTALFGAPIFALLLKKTRFS